MNGRRKLQNFKTQQIWKKKKEKKLTISEYNIVASLREHEELRNHGQLLSNRVEDVKNQYRPRFAETTGAKKLKPNERLLDHSRGKKAATNLLAVCHVSRCQNKIT